MDHLLDLFSISETEEIVSYNVSEHVLFKNVMKANIFSSYQSQVNCNSYFCPDCFPRASQAWENVYLATISALPSYFVLFCVIFCNFVCLESCYSSYTNICFSFWCPHRWLIVIHAHTEPHYYALWGSGRTAS